jgi:hypothetical protein
LLICSLINFMISRDVIRSPGTQVTHKRFETHDDPGFLVTLFGYSGKGRFQLVELGHDRRIFRHLVAGLCQQVLAEHRRGRIVEHQGRGQLKPGRRVQPVPQLDRGQRVEP